MSSPDFFGDEIHGFTSPSEYESFLLYIKSQIDSGELEEIPADENYGKGEIYGGRWFNHKKSDTIWRLVPPDIPFRGLWERVEVEK